MTLGQPPRMDTSTGRGPCSRVSCGHAEIPDHAHGFDGVRTHCALCGSKQCASYRPPGRRKCARCGVREDAHASLDVRAMLLVPPGVCPWWVRPSRLRQVDATLDALLRKMGL